MAETKKPMTDSTIVPIGGNYFKSSVKKAREALKGKALEHYEKLVKIIDMAAAAGDFETAGKYAWMLIEHMPKEDGEAVIDESAAKPKQLERGASGPIIQIGFKLGGIEAKQLEPTTIDIEKTDETD